MLITAFLVVAVVVHGVRWKAKHKNDPEPPGLVVSGISAFTGEIIASGQPNTELGDGKPPESACT